MALSTISGTNGMVTAPHFLAAQAGCGFWVRLLEPVVAASTETVIWLGMKL